MLKSVNKNGQDLSKLENIILMAVQDIPMCKIKINALIFEIDKQAFLEMGKKITGSTYIRKWNGPAISNLDEVLDKMCREKKIELVQDCENCDMTSLCSKLT